MRANLLFCDISVVTIYYILHWLMQVVSSRKEMGKLRHQNQELKQYVSLEIVHIVYAAHYLRVIGASLSEPLLYSPQQMLCLCDIQYFMVSLLFRKWSF